jgi:3',5'-cyclic AMP phosphodiesterase CpdA
MGCTSSQPYFFVHISDTQLGMMENNAGFSQESEIVANTISAINRLNPAFVVITGDLIHQEGNMEQIEELKRLLGQFKKSIPVYYVPGNHDVGLLAPDELLILYRENFGHDRFSISHNNTGLIGINSQLIWAKRDTLENEQYQWLENELKKSQKNNHRFVFAHHPLFLQTIDESDRYQNLPLEYRSKYFDLFDKYNVQYMFVGHWHRNHSVHAGNLTIIVTNGVCVSHSSDPPGFRIVKVYPDRVEHDYYSLETLPAKIDL